MKTLKSAIITVCYFIIIFLTVFLLASCAGTNSEAEPRDRFQISTTALTPAVINTQYSQQLAAIGGVPPYRWSVQNGKLPPGVRLSSTGLLFGRPTAAGDYSFIVLVVDSKHHHAILKFDWRGNEVS